MSCHAVNESDLTTNNTLVTAVTAALAPEPETLRITRTVLFSLIAVLSLVGNFVMCRAVCRQPGTKPFAYYLVSNLAFAEILSTICLVFTIHAYEPPWSWELGYTMCKILDPLQITSALVITTTLAILAMYRCLLLVKPLVAKPTRRQRRCILIFTWVGSAGLSVPASLFRVVNSYGDNCDIHACEEVFPDGYAHYQDVYSIVLFVINFALPLVIMATSYALVSKKIREHIFVIERLRDAQSKALSVGQPSTCVEQENKLCDEDQEEIELVNIAVDDNTEMAERNIHKKVKFMQEENKGSKQKLTRNRNESKRNNNNSFELENDLIRMIFAIVLIFVVCYIPFQVQFLMVEFKVQAFLNWPHYYTFSRFVFTLTCLPSALHPVFYGVMSKFYRKAFMRIISCRATK